MWRVMSIRRSRSALHTAVLEEQTEVVADLLIRRVCDVNLNDPNGNTPLHSAIESQNVSIIKLLLDSGADTGATNEENETPILLAIKSRNLKVIKLLMDAISDLETKDSAGCTLVDSGADTSTTNKNNETPILLALKSKNLKVVKLLMDAITDLEAKDSAGCTLLDSGADTSTTNKNNETPILLAIKSRNLKVVKQLIDANTDLEAKDSAGCTLLGQALRWGNSSTVQLFINAGANINFQDRKENTPLHYATCLSNVKIVKLLINAGANVNANCLYGNSSLHLAVWNQNEKILKELLDAGAKVNVKNSKANVIKNRVLNSKLGNYYLSMKKIRENAEENSGDTPLHIAAWKSNDENIFNLLLNAGAEVNAKDCYGVTPLHLAAHYSKNVNILKILLNAGADINAKDCNGYTPLHAAIGSNNISASKVLLNFGADFNAIDDRGIAPLRIAIDLQYVYIFKVLLEAGADVTAVSDDKKTTVLKIAIAKYVSNKDTNFLKVTLYTCPDINRYFVHIRDFMQMVHPVYRKKIKDILKLLIEYVDVNLVHVNGENIFSNFQKSIRVDSSRDYPFHSYRNTSNTSNTIYVRAISPRDLFPEKIDTYTHKIVIDHIAKLKALELPVDSFLLDHISSSTEYNEYLSKCAEELEKAKDTRLDNCWVMCFNLLVDGECKLVKYAGNEDLISDFTKNNLKKNFPIYGDAMESNLMRGIDYRKSFDEAASVLNKFLPIFSPTHLIIRDTLDVLFVEDWKRLSE